MTDLLIFSKIDTDEINGGSPEESIDQSIDTQQELDNKTLVGGLSVTGLLKKKKNDITDSKLYSFFENLAVPIGLTCYKEADEGGSTDGQTDELNDGVIKGHLFDRLFNMSSINLARGKARRTRKKIPQ
jgi:hypothetical protein